MPVFKIQPDFDAAALGLNEAESAVYRLLCSRRQCTSAELIKHGRVHHPQAIVEAINERLIAAGSAWLILCSSNRSPLAGPTQSMRTPLAYYRLRCTPHFTSSAKA